MNLDGSNYLSVRGGSNLIVMIVNGGSVFMWTAKSKKIIQNLAPHFIELERNVQYIPHPSENTNEQSDEEMTVELKAED